MASQLSSKVSASYSQFDDDVSASKSLSDLKELPNPFVKPKASGWNDDGFDDWGLDDVDEPKVP